MCMADLETSHRFTEPCPPKNVTVIPSCGDAMVSWSPSPVAETYQVVATGADGHMHTCNTTSNNCSLSELHCDRQYTVSVTASHENCTSKASQNVTVSSGICPCTQKTWTTPVCVQTLTHLLLHPGPCRPDGLSVTYHCSNESALLSWSPKDNAVEFFGYAQAANGDMLYCRSTNPTCTIHSLQCGTAYNFSVQASDGSCNSSFSGPVQSGAGTAAACYSPNSFIVFALDWIQIIPLSPLAPCAPGAIDVKLRPMRDQIQVMRFNWTQVTCNNTEYILKLTGTLLGDSQSQFELSSYYTSVTYFEIPLPCGSSYVATVESRNAAGASDPSAPLNGTTGRLHLPLNSLFTFLLTVPMM